MTDPEAETDDRHSADVVTGMVDHVLNLAATWPQWNRRPIEPACVYTAHNAIRRVTDHPVDHLGDHDPR